jgi:hypothetical protein
MSGTQKAVFGLKHRPKDTFGTGKKTRSFRDEEFYLSHYQKDANTEKGCGMSPHL